MGLQATPGPMGLGLGTTGVMVAAMGQMKRCLMSGGVAVQGEYRGVSACVTGQETSDISGGCTLDVVEMRQTAS